MARVALRISGEGLAEAIADALSRLDAIAVDPGDRVCVIELDGGGAPVAADTVMLRRLLDALAGLRIPVIAVVTGDAYGAIALVMAACDIVVMDERATLSVEPLAADQLVLAERLGRLLPERVVRRLVLTGESLGAGEAARLGGVIHAVRADTVAEAADRLADTLAAKSPTAMRLLKEAMTLTLALPSAEGLAIEALYTQMSAATPDGREAVRAFLEKRRPVWSAPVAATGDQP